MIWRFIRIVSHMRQDTATPQIVNYTNPDQSIC